MHTQIKNFIGKWYAGDMVESNIVFSAKFKNISEQKHWFQSLPSHITNTSVAHLCKCSERTIRDWRRGKFSPRYDCVVKLCSTNKIPFPHITQVSRKAHLSAIAKKGGNATVARYGKPKVNESVRQEHWSIWWNTKGKFHAASPTKPQDIKIPRKSKALAEFIGIMLGDGGVSRYRIVVTLNATDDALYSLFVIQLITRLFGVCPKMYKRKGKNAIDITVARILLVEYLHSLELPIGNKIKQGLNIPTWISKNPQYAKSCVRGLIDTDGSVFTHKYASKKKIYAYKKLSFTSASPSLLASAHDILSKNGIHSHISKTNVRVDSKACVAKYFAIIGSHNPKHLKRLSD